MASIVKPAKGKDDPSSQPTFKQQLDQEADNNRTNNAENSITSTVVEKITEYIPAAAHIIGGSNTDAKGDNEIEIPGPPHRPEDDYKIEEFVREQHRSSNGDEILAATK